MKQYKANLLEPVMEIKDSVGFRAKKHYLSSQKEQPSEGQYHILCGKESGTVRVHGLSQEGSRGKQSWTQMRFQGNRGVGMEQRLSGKDH